MRRFVARFCTKSRTAGLVLVSSIFRTRLVRQMTVCHGGKPSFADCQKANFRSAPSFKVSGRPQIGHVMFELRTIVTGVLKKDVTAALVQRFSQLDDWLRFSQETF